MVKDLRKCRLSRRLFSTNRDRNRNSKFRCKEKRREIPEKSYGDRSIDRSLDWSSYKGLKDRTFFREENLARKTLASSIRANRRGILLTISLNDGNALRSAICRVGNGHGRNCHVTAQLTVFTVNVGFAHEDFMCRGVHLMEVHTAEP